jgi:3-oxoacyl-ACP reductase-like protein
MRGFSQIGGTAMSMFGNIMSAIFGHSSSAAAAQAPAAAQAAASPAAPSSPSSAPASSPASPVDVAAIMDQLAAQATQQLNWRTSIVDLMKLINLDSSLTARKELAQELHYSGDTNDSASMNVWLHKQVMIKLAENGGKVPDELKH